MSVIKNPGIIRRIEYVVQITLMRYFRFASFVFTDFATKKWLPRFMVPKPIFPPEYTIMVLFYFHSVILCCRLIAKQILRWGQLQAI